MTLKFPHLSLVVLVGPSGSGKSTFASKHFLPTEVLSSDFCRGLVSDDQNDPAATSVAFELLHFIAGKRLAAGKFTVVDATSVKPEDRKPLVAVARQHHCLPVAIVFNLPERLCQERNAQRTDRRIPGHAIRQHHRNMRRSIKNLRREGFRHVFVLNSAEEVDEATIERQPLWNDLRPVKGPFDIIGDVHGCYDELEALLDELGYRPEQVAMEHGDVRTFRHPEGRRALFVGDLVDRGPRVLDSVFLVQGMVRAGDAWCVPGNHDVKLVRALRGRNVQITHGLDRSLAEIDALPEDRRDQLKSEIAEFLDKLVSHYVFDGGALVVAHAGMKEEMQGRGSGKVRDFAIYGETTGETDEFGLPVRYNWAIEYRGKARVVYGHTPVPEPEWLNRTVNIDTGCVFGGKLTALRYPELEFVSVPASYTYVQPAKPFSVLEEQPPALSAQQQHDEILDIEDVTGKRSITTRLHGNLTVREENTIAALEVMSRFAMDPRWLVYLPPAMSPSETSQRDGLLEHPDEAFAYYRHEGVSVAICEEKHMGSRAVVIVCRDEDVARRRFGVADETIGACYTRTGRRFFNEDLIERQFLGRVRDAFGQASLWERLETDWACLDCELMPWSAKALELLRLQYAAVGVAGSVGLQHAITSLGNASRRGQDVEQLLEASRARLELVHRFVDAYGRYCWTVESLGDLKLAPFHILATEGQVHADKDHAWHMSTIAEMCSADETLLVATPYKEVDLTDPESQSEAISWWEELTSRGGEGMVVKPRQFVVRGRRGMVQPAVKCRGREYLRIIYGPEYTAPEHLERLRARGLSAKRSVARREFALGIEGLERFVRGEPLRRTHECAFAVLALESEPVDPRL